MSNLAAAFDTGYYQTGSVDPAIFDDLPAGDYPIIITDTEMKDTKDYTGKYLQLCYDIAAGEHKGRKIFDRLNLINRNETAKRIAMQQLESICRATGFIGQLKDSSQLHRKIMIIRLGYDEKQQEGRRNSVKSYKPQTANPMPAYQEQQQAYAPAQQAMPEMPPAPQQAATQAAKAPWE